MKRHKVRAFALALVVLVAALGMAAAGYPAEVANKVIPSAPTEGPPTAPAPAAALDTAEVLARARPAVVTVVCTNEEGGEDSLGSGLIVAADGVVLTAWHVVAGQAQVRVKLATGATYPVQGLVGWEASRDFALLKIAAKDLPTVTLGDSDKVRQGDRVFTLGAPLGLEQTASEGIVSAVRELPAGGKLLQITAAISPGSSGGPVLNARGEAIGIASFMLTEGQSLNFAAPINDVKPRLKERGKVTPLAEAARTEFAGSAEALFLGGLFALPEDEEAPGAQKQFEQALALFRQAVEKRKDFADAWFCVGYCLGKLGRLQDALDAFKQAIRFKPDDAEAHRNLGVAYGKLGRWQDAVEACKQAVRLKPDYAEAHYSLGVAYENLGRPQDAVDAYKQAIRLKPDYAKAHYGLGWAYGKLGRWQEEIDAYKQAIRLKPDFAEAHLSLGVAYGVLGRPQDAVDAYKQAIRLKPDYAKAHYGLGLAYVELGRWQEAVDATKQAIRFKPDLAEAHLYLGVAYVELGRWQEAVDAYKQAIRLKPDYARAHYNLGLAYLLLDDRGRALDEYKILKDLDADLAASLFELLYP